MVKNITNQCYLFCLESLLAYSVVSHAGVKTSYKRMLTEIIVVLQPNGCQRGKWDLREKEEVLEKVGSLWSFLIIQFLSFVVLMGYRLLII